MMVNAQEEVGEGSVLHTNSHHTPTNTPKRKQRQAPKVHSPSSEIPVEESILTPSSDPLPSVENRRMPDADMFGVDDLEVTAASVEDGAAPTTATTAHVDDELTLEKTLIAIKGAKLKVISTVIRTPRAKGKAQMIEPEKPLKKKDQIALDEEVARKLEAKMRAKMVEEERISREKDKANRAVVEE
nr:hypothetical protein [Tanacetum cinerariifolium]